MNKLIVTIIALAFAVTAKAQFSAFNATPITLVSGGTNVVAVGITNTYNVRIDVPRSEYFALEVSAYPLLTNKFTLDALLFPSIDGTTFGKKPQKIVFGAADTLTNTITGTTYVFTTNVSTYGIPFWRLQLANTGDLGIMSNVTVRYNLKR